MKILVLNSSKGREIAKRLMEIFEEYISISVIFDHHIRVRDGGHWIICSSCLNHIDGRDLVVVAADDVVRYPTEIRCNTVLMSSKLDKTICEDAIVITYGQCAKDTITLTSVDRDEAVISLQRQVGCCNKNVIEPCEIVVKIREQLENDFILAVASILILTGNHQLLHNITI